MYARVTKTVNDKGIFVEDSIINNESKLQEIIGEDRSKDWYSSLFLYPEEGKKYFDEHGSIAGYKGLGYSNRLIFDLDSEDFEQVRNDTRQLLTRIKGLGINVLESVQVFFSGKKGFHVYVHLNEFLSNEDIASICKGIAGDLASFDTVIYNITRLFRLPYTLHQGSKLYKVELSPNELKDISQENLKLKARICEKYVRTGEIKPVADVKVFDQFKTVKHDKPVVVDDVDTSGILRGINAVDFTKCPPKMPRCIYALTHGIMQPGERSRVFFELARYYRNDGMPKDVAYNALKGIARLNAKLYPEHDPINKDEIWLQHVASVYNSDSVKEQKPGSPGIKSDNTLIKRYCDCIQNTKTCILHGKKGNQKDVYGIDDMHNDFSHFAVNLDKNTVKIDIPFIDNNMGINRGEVTLIVGSNGSGKTTFSLNLIENANHNGIPAVMFSMDMHRNQLFLKLATKCTNYTKDQVKAAYKEKNTEILAEIKQAIKDRYPHTYFIFKGTMTFDEIKETVNGLNAQHNIDIGLVLIDYAGRIAGPYTDTYANANYNALRSKEVADNLNVAMVILSQIARKSGDGSAPLRTSRAAKDSGSWEECAANVLTVWRPFMGKGEKDSIMKVYLAKNRMGPMLEGALNWDGSKGRVWGMSQEDWDYYTEVIEKEEEALYKSKFK